MVRLHTPFPSRIFSNTSQRSGASNGGKQFRKGGNRISVASYEPFRGNKNRHFGKGKLDGSNNKSSSTNGYIPHYSAHFRHDTHSKLNAPPSFLNPPVEMSSQHNINNSVKQTPKNEGQQPHKSERPNLNVNNSESIKSILEPNPSLLKRILPAGRIAKLSYGLERVLFNQGVHWLRDLRTNVYNFDPFLRQLPRPDQFNFSLIPEFTPASRDPSLQRMAMGEGCSFVTSTSSISQSMSTIYFVLSRMRPLTLNTLSQSFADEPRSFTLLTRSPTAVLLKPHGSKLRSIVIEKADEPESVLAQLGQVMERLLTESKGNFLKMLKSSPTQPNARLEDSYAYTIAGKILMRSQLDCHDPRLPLRTFDLKTRAALPIRMDVQNYQKYQEYRLLSTHGLYCSFEREYYDMCRSAFLKYKYFHLYYPRPPPNCMCSFQVRIGDMDGIFVAFHNANEIFGFQYISREEMDQRLYGNSLTGDQSFNLILQVYNAILAAVVPLYPAENTVRLTFATDKVGSRLVVFSEDCGSSSEEGIAAGRGVKQFNVTLSSIVNGFRTEQVLLNPSGADEWHLNCNIAQAPPNMAEYDSVRSKAIAPRTSDGEEESRGAVFLRIIGENSSKSPNFNSKAEVVAPWTIL